LGTSGGAANPGSGTSGVAASPILPAQPSDALERLSYRVRAESFWQVHRQAPAALIEAVLAAAAPVLTDPAGPAAIVWDLYAGSGLFTVPLGLLVPDGAVWAVESDPEACRGLRRNAHHLPSVHLLPADVADQAASLPRPHLVVLDPPRRGAGRQVCDAIVQAAPERVVYVACDPAALARDIEFLRRGGYRLADLRGLDMFAHTHHVECVAVFEPAAGDSQP
jgi:tRNA/tmRNA/rRNA uracil-C5-methylase (TrmA/RlmC/RlmD family)